MSFAHGGVGEADSATFAAPDGIDSIAEFQFDGCFSVFVEGEEVHINLKAQLPRGGGSLANFFLTELIEGLQLPFDLIEVDALKFGFEVDVRRIA